MNDKTQGKEIAFSYENLLEVEANFKIQSDTNLPTPSNYNSKHIGSFLSSILIIFSECVGNKVEKLESSLRFFPKT